MLTRDEEIKPNSPSLNSCGSSVCRAAVSPAGLNAVHAASAWIPSIDFKYGDKISQTTDHPKARLVCLCTRVHGAGFEPNTMDRFMLSNSHEVLFVN